MQETKQKASQIKEARDLWALERHLTDRHKDIDRKYEFRVSRLTRVFGTLLYDGRVTEEELHGFTRGQNGGDPFLCQSVV
jgi:hypothetical protein